MLPFLKCDHQLAQDKLNQGAALFVVLVSTGLLLSSITDSKHPAGAQNPNQFFVFSFDDAELPGLVKQRIRSTPVHNDDQHDNRRQNDGWLLNWLFGK